MIGERPPTVDTSKAPLFKRNLTQPSPRELDWRRLGLVGPAPDQRECRAHWAHSAATVLQAQRQRATGRSEPLSAQQLVDCSGENRACHGGSNLAALAYVRRMGGLRPAANYSYTGVQHRCRVDAQAVRQLDAGAAVRMVRSGNELELQYALAKLGPLVATIGGSLCVQIDQPFLVHLL